MTAFAVKGHTDRQHWAISTAIVVLVHGVIASAIATWWVAIKQPDLFGGAPIVIELAPAPLAPGAQKAAVPAVAPEQGMPNASPDKPMEKIEGKIPERTATKSEEKTELKPVGQQSVSVPMVAIAEHGRGERAGRKNRARRQRGWRPAARSQC